MTKENISTFLESGSRFAPRTQELYEWSLNCESVPFQKFLDLIGYEEEFSFADWKEPCFALGYVELGYLGLALAEYASSPRAVEEYVSELLEAEQN